MNGWPLSHSFPVSLLPRSTSLSLILGIFIGVSLSFSSSSISLYLRRRREERHDPENHEDRLPRPIQTRTSSILKDGVVGLIGEAVV